MTDGQAYRWHSVQTAYAPPPPQDHYQIYEHQPAMRNHHAERSNRECLRAVILDSPAPSERVRIFVVFVLTLYRVAAHRESYDGETADARTYVLPGYSVDTVSPTALYQHQVADSASAGEAYQQIETQHHTVSAGARPTNAHVGQISSAGSNSGSQSPAWSARPVRTSAKASTNSDDGYIPDSKRSSTDSGSSKKRANGGPAPRKRVPASCTPCRKKKLRCNRSMPCSSCVERGEPEGCVWEGCVSDSSASVEGGTRLLTGPEKRRDATPLYTVRNDNDLQELRAQVDRLQGLLDSLTKATRSPSPPDQQPNRHSPSGPPPAEKSDTDGDAGIKFNLGAQDLCAALSELALTGIMPPMPTGSESFAPGGRSGDSFITEAKRFLQTFTHRAGLSIDVPFAVLSPADAAPSPPDSNTSSEDSHGGSGGPAPIITPSSPRPSMSSILPLLPSTRELRTAFDFYAQVRVSRFSETNSGQKAVLTLPQRTRPAVCSLVLRACQSIRYRSSLASVQGIVGNARLGRTRRLSRPAFPRHDPRHLRFRVGKHDEQTSESPRLYRLSNRDSRAMGPSRLAVTAGRKGESNLQYSRRRLTDRLSLACSLSKSPDWTVYALPRSLRPFTWLVRRLVALSYPPTTHPRLSQFMTTGETITAGMSLLSLAVHAAFDLGLNRDPVQGGQSGYSFREREERRRAFWCLFALSMTITTVSRHHSFHRLVHSLTMAL